MRTVERWVRLTTIAAAVAAGCGEEGRVPQPTEPSSVGAIALPDGLTIGGPPMQLGVADGPRFSGIALSPPTDRHTCSPLDTACLPSADRPTTSSATPDSIR